MGIILAAVILAIIALIMMLTPVRVFAFIPILLIGLVFLFGAMTTVEAKHVGVVTKFGKPQPETLGSGFHWKAPWAKVTELDSTIQTWQYAGKSAIDVVLADKNEATVSATIRWSVNDENANDVFAEFRTADDGPTDGLGDAVVGTQFKAALFAVFADHDIVAEGALTADELAEKVQAYMDTKTKGMVDIDSVTISRITPGDKLQAKIEAIQAQVSQTTIAEEKKATAKAEAEANRILSESISNDPNVLVSKCLDMVADLPAGSLPAGFQCWNGAGGAVVLPSSK